MPILNEQVAQVTLILNLYIVYQNTLITVFQQIKPWKWLWHINSLLPNHHIVNMFWYSSNP